MLKRCARPRVAPAIGSTSTCLSWARCCASRAGSRIRGEQPILEVARQIADLEAVTDYEIDLRMTEPEDGEAAVARILALKPYNPAIRLEVSGGVNRPPYRKSNAIAALFEHARALAAELGIDLIDTFTGGGSDGNFTAARVATLDGLGVDGHGEHTLDEHLLVSSLVPRMLLPRRMFETLEQGSIPTMSQA